jgi:hypothetical protein
MLGPLILVLIVTLSFSNTFSLCFLEAPCFHSGYYPETDQLNPVPATSLLQLPKVRSPCRLRDLDNPVQLKVDRGASASHFLMYICVSKGSYVRAAMLWLDLLAVACGLLETPYSTPKTDKGTAVNTFLQVGATDS